MTLYLDTSSLVKLYVAEPGTDAVRRFVNAATIVATSMVAYPETRAALARRRREGALRSAAFMAAKRTFEADWPKYFAVEASASLCREAGEFAERYRLRGYDGVHLASFAEVARQAGTRQARFSSFDDRLNRAARSLRRRLARARASGPARRATER
ncbi:MAG: type II toxin-antitoxin system VapC family toxin [Acidobacteria bacterium]|nr:type II toxin-antitoxin system VapC family toxin [Acidobacteriota bacterium]